ncbi:MAG: thioredoxin [Prevotellaceae bacterium]|jgi:thioredoxin 1|nr:thioredoxin [Prevotellaceae bacterium]
MALEITDANFEQTVLKSDKLVVVDFWATWCGPCRAIAPIIDELHKEYEGKVVVGKVDVDANDNIPAQHGIRSIPTVLFFKNGQMVDKIVGAAPKTNFVAKINELM